MSSKEDLVVWWTSQTDCEAIGDVLHLGPEYLRDEYRRRHGRPGRGRLWVTIMLPQGLRCYFDSPEIERVIDHYGGVVMWACDLVAIDGLPGLVTNLRGMRYRP